MNLPTVSPYKVISNNQLTCTSTDFELKYFPLEDELLYRYFYTKARFPLSKRDIRTLGKCLRRMLVLDPRNRAQTHELLEDLWFTRNDQLVYEADWTGSGCFSGWIKDTASIARRFLGIKSR